MQENIPKRLKELRKKLALTQEEFAKKIGLSRANVGNIEYGRVLLTDRNIITICQTFNVNEDWLRNGNEPIFNEKENDIQSLLQNKYGLSEFASSIVKNYIELPKEQKKFFEDFVSKVFQEMQGQFEITSQQLVDEENEKLKRKAL